MYVLYIIINILFVKEYFMDIFKMADIDFNATYSSFLCKQILRATAAFNRLLLDNSEFFSYPEFSSVKGNLLNYSIEHCLYEATFTENANCKAYQKEVNRYKRSILHLQTEHFILTTSKTYKWYKLPSPSKYKLTYAKQNAGSDGQLSFDFVNSSFVNDPYYALLTYGYNSLTSECTHIDLLIPDADYKKFVYHKDILSVRNEMLVIPTNSEVEETVAKLKPKFSKKIIDIGNGEKI